MAESEEDLFSGLGVLVELRDPEAFNIIVETLTRIGVYSKQTNTLFQSCHILHKRGLYIICHFKELFLLDGKTSTLDDNDKARRNTIAKLLEQWELVKIDPDEDVSLTAPVSSIRIISFKDKADVRLEAKYTVGKRALAPLS